MKWLLIIIPLLSFAIYDSRPRVRAVENSVATTTPREVVVKKPVENYKAPETVIEPQTIIQGDPALIEVRGLATTSVRSIKFNKADIEFSQDGSVAEALVGIDLRASTGSFPVVVTLDNGQTLTTNLKVGTRVIAKAPLGIPESLGGNTKESEQTLVNSLVEEAAIMNAVTSTSTKLWDGEFRFPLNGEITITDTYGYSRITGGSSLSHKGTDFRAATGTPVYSMNSGEVAYTGFLRDYGNVLIVDHGLGLQSVYMHLSEILVKKGERVEKGTLIAKSGATGYVLGPHLHLSIRINHISIDPMKFMDLLGEK